MIPFRPTASTGTARLAALALAATVALIAGCGASDSPPGGTQGTVCSDDGGCPGDQICRAGYCTVESGTAGRIHARFFPPNSSNYLPQSARELRPGRDSAVDVALEPNVVASGTLQTAAGDQNVPGGRVIFSRSVRPRADRVRPPFQSAAGRLQSGQSFEVTLLEGLYDIRFSPESSRDNQPSYPPVFWNDRRVVSGARTDLEIPSSEEIVTINGRLEFTPSGAGNDAAVGVPSARVLAVASEGPLRETTVDQTDSIGGSIPTEFSLRALPSEEPVNYDLIVGPSRENPFVPRRRFSAGQLERTGDGDRGLSFADESAVNLQSLNIGTFPRVDPDDPPRVEVQMQKPDDIDAESLDWSMFRVVIEASDLDAGRFVRTGNLDSEGSIAFGVLPVEYDGWVLPPPDSKLKARTFEFSVPADKSPVSVRRQLKSKRVLTGRVVNARGDAVADATIEFTLVPGGTMLGTVAAERRLESRRTTTVTTSGDGTFRVWLERAEYRVLTVPPYSSGLPRGVRRLRIEEENEPESIRVELPKPLLVRGHVYGRLVTDQGTRSRALPRTRVEFHAVRYGVDTVLGTARAGDGGRFYSVLPAATSGER